jgi:hypothetical protein
VYEIIPSLNSFVITCLVDFVTLNVEFCSGKAGVIIGIKWKRSETRVLGSQIISVTLNRMFSVCLLNSTDEIGHIGARSGVGVLQNDGMWPLPLGENKKKFLEQNCRRCIWIKLACSGHQNCPGDTAKKAQDIGINSVISNKYGITKRIFFYILLRAHSLTALSVKMKFLWLGMSLRISSATLQPER